jgi:hypothetical protein
MGTDPNAPTDPGAAETAKKLADQTIDLLGDAVGLARDLPVDTAKLLVSKLKAAIAAVEDATKGK